MTEETPWRVEVRVDDGTVGERTRAWTRLRTPDGTTFVGVGEARHSPMGIGDLAAVSHALSDLTRQLSPAAPSRDRHSTLRHGLAELAGYLGGGLMFGGAALLVATSWADLTRPGRVALLTAVTVVFLSAGLLVSGRPLPRRSMTGGRSRLAAVLLALGAGTSALTAGSITDTERGFWAAVAGFVVATLGYLVVRSVIGVLVAAVFSGMAVGMFVGEVLDASTLALSVALVAVGLAWNVLDASGSLTPRGAGFAVGAAVALVGAQQPLGEPGGAAWAYGLTFVVALVWLTGNLWHRSPVLLVAGIVGLTIAIPQAIWDWTDGAVGGALIALIAGAVLLIASGFGLRIGGPKWQHNRQNPATSRAHHRTIPGAADENQDAVSRPRRVRGLSATRPGPARRLRRLAKGDSVADGTVPALPVHYDRTSSPNRPGLSTLSLRGDDVFSFCVCGACPVSGTLPTPDATRGA